MADLARTFRNLKPASKLHLIISETGHNSNNDQHRLSKDAKLQCRLNEQREQHRLDKLNVLKEHQLLRKEPADQSNVNLGPLIRSQPTQEHQAKIVRLQARFPLEIQIKKEATGDDNR